MNLKSAIKWMVFVLLLSLPALSQEKASYSDFFWDKTMRFDYFHTGDAGGEIITCDQIYIQGKWAGNMTHLLDPFNIGRYAVKIYEESSGKLIFSKGFDSYFGEYKTTNKAIQGIKRTYHETVLFPCPKDNIKLVLEIRDRGNKLKPLYEQDINPNATGIIQEKLADNVNIYPILKTGHPHISVDIAILGEGYTRMNETKFIQDLKRMVDVFFAQEPYQSHKKNFNIYGVLKFSFEEGCDEPRHGQYKNTCLAATFNSLDSSRYLLTEDNRSVRDIAAHVPYDTLVILVNHERYGGGGIYNLFCTLTSDSQWSDYLLLHEFGHSFSGLADEYYTSSVAYSDFYPKGIEPLEPNITALLNPEKLKWKELITEGIEVPTPWDKEKFDKMDLSYQKAREEIQAKIARMKIEGADRTEIQKAIRKSEDLSMDHSAKIAQFLKEIRFQGEVGAFEGAGYSSKGLYRPMLDCIMFTKGLKPYCKVCEKAILQMILHYTQ